MHKHTTDVAARVDVAWCPCCMKFFHTVRRCIQHLSCGSSKCKQAIIAHLPVITHATPYEAKLTRKSQN
eukprot:6619062-Alexandrium_andersonii.AAC.1